MHEIQPTTYWGPLETPVHQHVAPLHGSHLPWRDNAIFFWWDPDHDVYGALHASTSPTSSGSRARCSVTVGDKTREISEPLLPGTMNSRSITVNLGGSLQVDHPSLRIDIRLEPLFEALDFTRNRALGGVDENNPLHHYQHAMRASGTVWLGDQEHEFNGAGWRDRTWGYRDEALQWIEYICITSVFEDGAIVALKMRTAGADLRTVGWRITEAGIQPITSFTIAHDAAGLLADATIGGDTWSMSLRTVARKAGFWAPMGERQTGRSFSAYDEFAVLERDDGAQAVAMTEHGILRQVS